MQGEPSNQLLRIEDLNVHYETLKGRVKAVQDVDLTIDCGEFVGLSGESGCGKTTTAMTVMHLLPKEGIVETGSLLFNGVDTL
ncbi:MAG: ATP-binding cassette domain-containing protein, partial [Candidatus Thorarchaeota archaeon]